MSCFLSWESICPLCVTRHAFLANLYVTHIHHAFLTSSIACVFLSMADLYLKRKVYFGALLYRAIKILLLLPPHLNYHGFENSNNRKHRWWVYRILQKSFQQGAYHNLVKERQLDGELFRNTSD